MSAERLTRLRSAVVAVLALTVALSLTANVLSAEPSLIGRAVAAWPPVALLICTDLISRVPTSRRALGVARQVAAVLIAGIAAALSYGHMVTLAADHGASDRAAHVIPLTVDGLAIVASLCLLEISARLRQHTTTAPAMPSPAPSAAAPQAASPALSGLTPSDRTDRTDKTLFPQVRGGDFCQTRGVGPSDRTDKTPSRPRRQPHNGPQGRRVAALATGTGELLRERVHQLIAEHPDWTQAAIAEQAGCSVRTVRRHLSTTTPTSIETTTPTTAPGAEAGAAVGTAAAAAEDDEVAA